MDPKKRQRIDMTRVNDAINEAFAAANVTAEQLAERRNLIALLDSIKFIAPPANILVQLHDYDGSKISTARTWAQDENVQHAYGLKDGYCCANLELTYSRGIVVVIHDMRTYQQPSRQVENVGGDWSPAQMAVVP